MASHPKNNHMSKCSCSADGRASRLPCTCQSSFSSMPKASASSPRLPRGLSLLMSWRYAPDRNMRARGAAWLRHCRLLFMKQVLPRLPSPASPLATLLP